MSKHKKRKKKRHRPYEPVKMKFVKVENPLRDAPADVRRKAVLEVAAKARVTFDAEYPKIVHWFDTYDPIYILAFCVFYFLTSERGVDKEAVQGTLEFPPHYLELLQAFALMRDRLGTPAPLGEKAEELLRSMRELGSNLALAQTDYSADATDSEVQKRYVLAQMRAQTLAIRNWAFPDQTFAHLKALFAGQLNDIIGRAYRGVSAIRIIDTLVAMMNQVDERLNSHFHKLRAVVRAKDFDSTYREYRAAFPMVRDDPEGMRRVFTTMCGGDLRSLQTLLVMHSDLHLEHIFTFSIDEIMQAYGEESHRDGVLDIFNRWALEFRDLAGKDPKHFLYSNPVLQRPFIRLGGRAFFWVLSGVLAHTLPGMLEALVPPADRQRYSERRSDYLEDCVEALFRKAFPDGHVYRGSQWRPAPGDATQYENDLLVVIDSTAIVVECKSHMVDAPARRGAEFRLIDTLEDQVVSASDQAQRFVDFLKARPQRHAFRTKAGSVNDVNASRLVRFIPMSVTYENLGFVSSNLKEAVKAGLIQPGHSLVPSICITDLELVFEILDSQAQRIHYLARRAEIEKTMHYFGSESDLLAFYVETGFNIGEVEEGGLFLALAMKSKELAPYFMAKADGVSVPKPSLQLTDWWKDTLERIEQIKSEFWTELAYIFLSVDFRDQGKFKRQFKRLADRVAGGRAPQKHNWLSLLSGTRSKRPYSIVGYPYTTDDRDERNDMINDMAAGVAEEMPVLGIAVIGVNLNAVNYPYNVLAYIPGHAEGAPEVARLLEPIA